MGKDFTAALIAEVLNADLLVMLTTTRVADATPTVISVHTWGMGAHSLRLSGRCP